MSSKRLVYDLSFQDLLDLCDKYNEPAFRAKQVWEGLYIQFWQSTEEMTTLPIQFRQQLTDELVFSSFTTCDVLISKDRETIKTLFHLQDGKAIEAVLMKYEQRRTLCISTQVGCAMGCVFCATGQMGFQRNLTSGEIIEQVIFYARQLMQNDEQVTNIVIMGMGEPFLNFKNTIAAIDTLNDSQGMNLGERRFTISTVGIVPGILEFAELKRQINLAISLHAANDELRSRLLPINRKYPLQKLMASCHEYIQKTNRRITFEWALIQGVNDSIEHAKELARLIRGMMCHVNIIPLNPTQRYIGLPSPINQARAFQVILTDAGIPCTIRLRRGIDIQAGCGQLAIQHQSKTTNLP